MYKLFIRPILFLFDPEKVHHFTFNMLKLVGVVPGLSWLVKKHYQIKNISLEKKVFGITFPNQIGLAAGMDKDGVLVNEFSNLGFGFIEIGTITPKAQPGNEKPRLFRLKKDQGIINRMGFNNSGVDKAIENLKSKNPGIIVGGNIGKNKITPNDEAINDYIICLEKLHPWVDYFVVNVSSPNTPGLRELQEKEPLKKLLFEINRRNLQFSKPKPVLLKIAPDLNNNELNDIIEIVIETNISGIIATNTTTDRSNLMTDMDILNQIGSLGGLSGKPLKKRSTEIIRYICETSKNKFPVIAVGGIHSESDALEKIKAGASLVQLYTGFVYEGPSLIKRINKAILQSKAVA